MKVYVVQFEFRGSIVVDAVFDSLDKAKDYVNERGFKAEPYVNGDDDYIHGFCLEIEGCDPFPHEAGWAWIYKREAR